MNRDTTLDYLRGFAIMSIVIGHLYYFSGRANGSIVWNICNTIQIPIFIYVSGFLAQYSIQKYHFSVFIQTRFIRLIVPFVSFFIIWLIIKGISISNAILFFTDEFKQGFWFMIVLFELMVILGINRIIERITKINIFFLDVISLIIINIYHFFFSEHIIVNHFLSINLLWHYYPIFMIGVYSNKIPYLLNKRISFLYIITYACAFYLMYAKNIHAMTALCNFSSLFFFVSFFNDSRHRIQEAALVKTGIYSLQIYLLHILFFGGLKNFIPIVDNRCIEAGLFIFLSITICYLSICISYLLMKSKWIKLFLFGINQ